MHENSLGVEFLFGHALLSCRKEDAGAPVTCAAKRGKISMKTVFCKSNANGRVSDGIWYISEKKKTWRIIQQM